MKKMIYISMIGLSLIGLAACGSGKDSKEKADSVNTNQDSLHNKNTGTGDWAISAPDAKFAVDAANGGMAEVVLGKLAQSNAGSDEVRKFGTMMINDHSKANIELKELADKKRIVLPDSIGDEEKKLQQELAGKKGAAFDKAYVDAMVEDHKKDIAEFEEASGKVKYPEMKQLIDKAIPMLKMHLTEIEKIQQKMK